MELTQEGLTEGIKNMGTVFKLILFMSSYIPVFIMIFLNSLSAFRVSAVAATWKKAPAFWIALIIISVASTIILIIWLILIKKESNSGKPKYELKKITAGDAEVLNFFVTFIIPILSLKPSSLPSITMNIILFIIEGVFFISNNTLYYNVLLLMFGYHVYTDENENVIITRKRRSQLIKNGIHVSQVGTTNIFYL